MQTANLLKKKDPSHQGNAEKAELPLLPEPKPPPDGMVAGQDGTGRAHSRTPNRIVSTTPPPPRSTMGSLSHRVPFPALLLVQSPICNALTRNRRQLADGSCTRRRYFLSISINLPHYYKVYFFAEQLVPSPLITGTRTATELQCVVRIFFLRATSA